MFSFAWKSHRLLGIVSFEQTDVKGEYLDYINLVYVMCKTCYGSA